MSTEHLSSSCLPPDFRVTQRLKGSQSFPQQTCLDCQLSDIFYSSTGTTPYSSQPCRTLQVRGKTAARQTQAAEISVAARTGLCSCRNKSAICSDPASTNFFSSWCFSAWPARISRCPASTSLNFTCSSSCLCTTSCC